MRLIDADKLKHVVHCTYSDDLEILEKIDEQPTAFDVDKIAKQLKCWEFRRCQRTVETINSYAKGSGAYFFENYRYKVGTVAGNYRRRGKSRGSKLEEWKECWS